jgi:energy-coupling factor transporter transmembrane protein EcfT
VRWAAGVSAGSYGQDRTPLHEVDPRVKLVLLCAATLAVFAVEAWWGLAAFLLATAALEVSARVSAGEARRAVGPLVPVLAVVVLANALRFDGTGEVALWGALSASPAGCARGLKVAVRVVCALGFSLVMTKTTTATELTDALEALMGPLRRVGVPVDDLALMLSVAVRFIPLVGEQLELVATAQRARGARVGEGGPVRRVTSWVPVMIPLVVGLFRRADALAASMESRCYTGQGRTRLVGGALRGRDVAVLLAGVALCVAAALVW